MTASPAVLLEGVTCRFGGTCALDALSLEVAPGKVTGIVGPNGAGKTTLLDVLLGLVRPTSGRVTVLGQDVLARPQAIRARVGVVPQETALYEELTAVENLEFSAALHGIDDASARIAAVLAVVGLAPRGRERVGILSGGMQRRLAIARALLHDPELLVLDEPTLGVDVEARHQIWNHVRALRDDGKTVLLATNYLDEAESLCDSVAVVRAGKLVAHETPASLVARVGRCLELDCAGGDAAEVKARLAEHPRALRTESVGERITVYVASGADPDELVRAAMAVSRLKGFRARSPDLMEVLRVIGEGSA